MSLSEIFMDAVKYPFSDITKFLIVGVLVLLASLSSIIPALQIDNSIVTILANIIALVCGFILTGYGVKVIKKGIEHSNEIPDIDPIANILDGIKATIISIVYFIIPIIITAILLVVTGVAGYELNHAFAALGFAGIIAFIIFVLFAIFGSVALARFADTGDMGAAFKFGEVFEEAKKIGILKIILFFIILFVIVFVASFISVILALIPYIGIIIGTILIGAFITLCSGKALGLLYADA